MIWILVALASLACVELIVRLPAFDRMKAVLATAKRSVGVVTSKRISDHWKERVLPQYSLKIAVGSLATAGLIVLAFSPIILLAVLGPLFGQDVMGLLLSWQGIVGISALAAGYAYVRNRLVGKVSKKSETEEYSSMAKMTHRLALAAPSRGEMLLDIEHMVSAKPPTEAAEGRHVFVSGLARAGTTVLMRAIYESSQFASLTYRDMPFVMAPNLWARLSQSSKRDMEKTERAHGDSVLVDFDSPEALEEPFWRTFCGKDYIKDDRLVPHSADDEVINSYRKFVDHALARYGRGRYLAKNNNNILRLGALRSAFPNASILIPFRSPIDQAASLKKQHERFLDVDDPFTHDYMSWLAHHEFGPGHRPFDIADGIPDASPETIDYWLALWVNVHRFLVNAVEEKSGASNLIPVSYEDVCSSDRGYWHALCDQIGIAAREPDFEARIGTTDEEVNVALLKEASQIYEALRDLSRAKLSSGTN